MKTRRKDEEKNDREVQETEDYKNFTKRKKRQQKKEETIVERATVDCLLNAKFGHGGGSKVGQLFGV